MQKPGDYFKRDNDTAREKATKDERLQRLKEGKPWDERSTEEANRGPFGGATYVVSGQFKWITREKMEEFIKKNGGNLAMGVNKKTDFVVIGHILDDGRQPHEGKKYQIAVKLGKKMMNEDEFEQHCKIKFQNPDFLLGRKTKKDTTA